MADDLDQQPDGRGGAVRVNRFGAIWCAVHRKWECAHQRKKSRGGGPCHGWAIVGLRSCRMHVGKPLSVAKAEGAAMSAWSAENPGSDPIKPAEAVLGMLQMSWSRVHVYAALLEAQVAQAQADRQEQADQSGGGFGPRGAGPIGEGVGLVGHTFAAVKDEGIYASGEAIRALATLEAAERDRCVRYAKVAHDMGIADREIRLAEQQGQIIALVVRKVLDGLNLTPEQHSVVPTLVPQILRAAGNGELLPPALNP